MKGYKNLISLGMVLIMALSFYMLIDTRATTAKNYKTYIETARDFAKQAIYKDALQNYNQALLIDNSLELNLEIGEIYVKADDEYAAIGWGEKMIETFPHSSEAYDYLLKLYHKNNDFNRCFVLYNIIQKRKVSSKTISKIMKEIEHAFYYGEAYDNVGVFSEGYCAVEYEGEWGLANEIGEKTAPFKFKSVGNLIDGLAPIQTKDGECYYIDFEGNKKMAILIKGEITDISSVVGDVYAVKEGFEWSFYNKEYKKLNGGYKNVSLLANGVVAVEEDGKWVILNDKFEKISDQKYTEVVQDERGIIYRNDTIFVNKDGKYYMIDNTGKEITQKTFLNAKTFLDATYAAVETDKGWTFVNSKGEFVFKDAYFEEANSFSNGFAAVQKSGQWGYIDIDGNVAIDFQFKEVKDFNASGCAFVKNEDIWQLVRLYSKNYES